VDVTFVVLRIDTTWGGKRGKGGGISYGVVMGVGKEGRKEGRKEEGMAWTDTGEARGASWNRSKESQYTADANVFSSNIVVRAANIK